MRAWRRRVLLGVPIALLAAALPGRTGQQPSQPDRCGSCHAGVDRQAAESSPASLHAASVPCEACHGDATAHAASQGSVPPALSAPRCTPCHERIAPHSRWKGSVHEKGGLQCASCHSIHGNAALAGAMVRPSLLSRPTESETCFACHAAVRHAQTQRSTHLFRDELGRPKVECSDCHDVHGAAGGGEALLARPSLNDVCYTCHDELRGPFLWEHPPARENCAACHAPHGSNNAQLLTMRQPMLCHTCHMGDVHVAAIGGPRTGWEMNRSCVNCHRRVHGSNHPSGITLQR
ncbi:MAG TPA: cytochrome c3 family protein [Thermoanaerobaculia bacterium]|nr:cytochrome c3 family protein [Thermoanaerobaculia bacterium]